MGDLKVKVNKISIKGIILEVEKWFLDDSLEVVDMEIKLVDNWLDVLEVVAFKLLELSDSAEKINKLTNTSAEEVKLSEDLVGVKVELLSLWHALKSGLGDHILVIVCILESLARSKDFNELISWVLGIIPKTRVLQSGDLSLSWIVERTKGSFAW